MVIENNSTKKANSTASNSTTDATKELSLAELEKTDDKPLDAKKNATNSTDI
jgi:hypothetical protein